MFRVLSSGQKPRFLPAGSNGATPRSLKRPKAGFGQYQTGVTAIGWLILLIPFAVIIYAGIRLLPIYLDYMDVARSMNELQSEYQAGGATPDSIRSSLQKHFDVDGLAYPTVKDINITRSGQGWRIEAAYYDQAPLFAGITLQVAFDKTVTLGGGG
jgi:hypothetical protein